MSMSDPISDMLTRIRNAQLAEKTMVSTIGRGEGEDVEEDLGKSGRKVRIGGRNRVERFNPGEKAGRIIEIIEENDRGRGNDEAKAPRGDKHERDRMNDRTSCRIDLLGNAERVDTII